jgi:hypothetical protein
MVNPTCSILHRRFPVDQLTLFSAIHPNIAALIRRAHPHLSENSVVSNSALAPFRAEYLRSVRKHQAQRLLALQKMQSDLMRELNAPPSTQQRAPMSALS